MTGDGWLLTATPRGPARRVLAGVRALISDGRRELWALRSDRRTLVKLHPVTGRELLLVRAGRRLSDRIALTRDRLWGGAARGPVLVAVRLLAGARS